ncbi:acyltransferase family protein [Hymenobacter sp. B81]|uniref:acyltransferase family protein n=1 Tax=Hymenobacter sp. B81 TaxID=3344878 RepID=UPI0037DCD721
MSTSPTPVPPAPRHLRYLDGLRGLAALGVLLNHYLTAFYPTMLTGEAATAHLPQWPGFEYALAATPLNLLRSNGVGVCVFFVLSGFVLSEAYFRRPHPLTLQAQAARRYLRLMLPVAASALLGFAGLRLDWFRNDEVAAVSGAAWFGRSWQTQPSVLQFVKDVVFDIPLAGEPAYNPVLWTLHLELMGSFLVFALLAFFGTARNRGLIYLAAATLLFLSPWNLYLVAFVLGVALNDWHRHGPAVPAAGRPWLVGLLLLGFVGLGSYPTTYFTGLAASPYRWLLLPRLGPDHSELLHHIAAAALLLGAVLLSVRLQRLLQARWLVFLGSVSFGLYLLHFLVLGSFSARLFLGLHARLGYHLSFGLMALASVPVLLLAAYALHRWVIEPSSALSRRVYGRWFQPRPAPAPAAAE